MVLAETIMAAVQNPPPIAPSSDGPPLFNFSISLGDLIALAMFVGTLFYNYFALWRKIDRVQARVNLMDTRIQNNETRFEDLRRGRGLIMENWPQAMQRVMGFRNGSQQ